MARPKALAIVAVSLTALVAASADAHDWYPAWCCSDQDCRTLFEERGETVVEEADGWHLWDGRVAAKGTAKPSPDRRFHLCEEATTGAIICFFAPIGGA